MDWRAKIAPMAEVLDDDPHAPHRRWLARPRSFGPGMLLSLAVHLGLAIVVVGIWSLLPAAPRPPVKISTIYRNPPSREALGLNPDGSHPEGWKPPETLAK